MQQDVVGDESGLDHFRVLFRGYLPGHEQATAVAQLPDISAAPMSNWLALTVTAVLVEPLSEPSATIQSTARLTDIEDGGSIDPRTLQLSVRYRRILSLEPSGDAGWQELRLISGWPEDDVAKPRVVVRGRSD